MGTGDLRMEGSMDCPINLDLVKLPKRQFFADAPSTVFCDDVVA